MRIDIPQQACPCCGGELHRIGETISEMLDHVPARWRIKSRPLVEGLQHIRLSDEAIGSPDQRPAMRAYPRG
jgi:hypothetical protein